MLSLWRSPLFDATTSAISLLRALDDESAGAGLGEVSESESAYTLRIEVPGLKADDLELDVTESTVKLSGERKVSVPEGFEPLRTERRSYRVSRSLRFGKKLDPDGVEAKLEDGVLTVTLPKSDAARARRVAING